MDDILFESWETLKRYCKINNLFLPSKKRDIISNSDIKLYGKSVSIIKGKNNEGIIKSKNKWGDVVKAVNMNNIQGLLKSNVILYTINKNLIKRKVK